MLAFRPLDLVSDVNHFRYTTEIRIASGDAGYFYFQLYDPTLNREVNGFIPGGLRYMPAAGTTVVATVLNLDSTKQFSRSMTQPYALDPSIWRLQYLATDPIEGTVALKFVVSESGKSSTIFLQSAIVAETGIGDIC